MTALVRRGELEVVVRRELTVLAATAGGTVPGGSFRPMATLQMNRGARKILDAINAASRRPVVRVAPDRAVHAGAERARAAAAVAFGDTAAVTAGRRDALMAALDRSGRGAGEGHAGG